MVPTSEYQPTQWLLAGILSILVIFISVTILKKELKKQREKTTIYASPKLRIYYMLCLISGLMIGIIELMHFIDYGCNIFMAANGGFHAAQMIAMGYYQLSRLYYCFSQTKVHSKKGYPDCLFIFMYSIGGIILIWIFILPSLSGVWTLHCSMDFTNWVYTEEQFLALPFYEKWGTITGVIYFVWDIFTLLLYANKVYSFRRYKSTEKVVVQRIMSILVRIIILTLFYEVFFVLSLVGSGLNHKVDSKWMGIVSYLFYSAKSVSMSYSIFLMQEHNSNEYRNFLNIFHKIGCQYICCCCCRSAMQYELEQIVNSNQEDKQNSSVTGTETTGNGEDGEVQRKEDLKVIVANNTTEPSSTAYDTHDISDNHGKLGIASMQLSVETPDDSRDIN